jgi:hypothetical protein
LAIGVCGKSGPFFNFYEGFDVFLENPIDFVLRKITAYSRSCGCDKFLGTRKDAS